MSEIRALSLYNLIGLKAKCEYAEVNMQIEILKELLNKKELFATGPVVLETTDTDIFSGKHKYNIYIPTFSLIDMEENEQLFFFDRLFLKNCYWTRTESKNIEKAYRELDNEAHSERRKLSDSKFIVFLPDDNEFVLDIFIPIED